MRSLPANFNLRPSDSEVNTTRPRFEISRNNRTFEVNKLFIIWLKTGFFKRKSSLYIRECARVTVHSSPSQGSNCAVCDDSVNKRAFSEENIADLFSGQMITIQL